MAIIYDAEKISRSFKAYDVRGRVPEDLDEELAFGIGRAYAKFLNPKRVAVGQDIRLSSEAIVKALLEGLTQSGVDVLRLGICGTEQVYFATFHEGLDGGIMVTASHNPPNYNGMKMVREEAKPISEDSGLKNIAEILMARDFLEVQDFGKITEKNVLANYTKHVLNVINVKKLKPLKVVFNSGNGTAGETLDALLKSLPIEPIRVHHEPDGHFPNGVPNPLLPDNRHVTSEAILHDGADLGVAWDGDFDRCFFFDERGEFIDGYYIVGLLAFYFLAKENGARIVYDPRLVWNTLEMVEAGGGKPILYRSGHAFIKKSMRDEDAIYGGETSAHHYFRQFGYCDSGMLPWLVILEMMSVTGKKLSELVGERRRLFPVSGEINTKLDDIHVAQEKIKEIKTHYQGSALKIDETDGLSMEFKNWRFNLRPSNTEPLLRLNLETRGNETLLEEKTGEVLARINA